MKIEMEINGNTCYGDMSGPELEVIAKIAARMRRGQTGTQDDQDVLILGAKISFRATIINHEEVSQEEHDAYTETQNTKTRAAMFAKADWTELTTTLYYQSIVKYNERKDFHFDHTGTDDDAAMFAGIDSEGKPFYVWVYKDGRVARNV